MFKIIRAAVSLFMVMTLLTGLAYPLVVTGIAQALFPRQARGSLIVVDGKAVGSSLIGQQFDAPQYFWGRISATAPVPYNAAASSGSNLGPTNPALVDVGYQASATQASNPAATQPAPTAPQVNARVMLLRDSDPTQKALVPVDLATASGSGLDPEVSPAAAMYQIGRVARARGLDESVVSKLIEQNLSGRQLGVLGEPRVNVLMLNLALDKIHR